MLSPSWSLRSKCDSSWLSHLMVLHRPCYFPVSVLVPCLSTPDKVAMPFCTFEGAFGLLQEAKLCRDISVPQHCHLLISVLWICARSARWPQEDCHPGLERQEANAGVVRAAAGGRGRQGQADLLTPRSAPTLRKGCWSLVPR